MATGKSTENQQRCRLIAELENLRFFRNLSYAQLEMLSENAKVIEYHAEDIIFNEDCPEKYIGYMVSGEGRFSATGEVGGPPNIKTFKHAPIGSIFLDGFSATWTLRAETEVRVIAWSLDYLAKLEEKYPALALAFYKGVNFYLIQNMRRLITEYTDVTESGTE
ncbi:MAG: hypothetical protein OCC46_09065 [Pseudodesulfovibrio sp.]